MTGCDWPEGSEEEAYAVLTERHLQAAFLMSPSIHLKQEILVHSSSSVAWLKEREPTRNPPCEVCGGPMLNHPTTRGLRAVCGR